MLKTVIGDYLDNLPLVELNRIHFQQDGAPPHSTKSVRDYLYKTFGDKWIGRTGPINWPVRSPDLSPLDYFLWAHLKRLVHDYNPHTPTGLREGIIRACNETNRGLLMRAQENLRERARKCFSVDGGLFEKAPSHHWNKINCNPPLFF